MFAWDEAKRPADLRKHGIDFAGAEKIFTLEDDRESCGEQRFLILSLLEDQGDVSDAH